MKKILTHWTIAFVTLFLLTWVGVKDPQVKEILRLKSFDLLFQSQEKEISQDIAIIELDEKAIEIYGQWPWKRDVLANLIEELRAAEVGVIVLPILFAEEDRLGGDDALAKALKDNFVVVAQTGTNQTSKNGVPRGVAKIGNPLPHLFEWNGMVGPLPKLAECANGVGVINTAPEIDGVIRRVPLLMKIGEDVYPNMAIETIRVAVGDPSYQVKADSAGIVALRVPAYATINTDPNGRVWVRWNKQFKTISASAENFDELAGTTVIIAMTAEGLGGVVATPTGEQYDYVISAQTLQTILDGKTIKRYDELLELLAGLLLGIAIILITRFLPYWVIGLSLIGIFGSGVYYFQHMFTTQLVLVDITWALLTFFIVGFHSTFNRFILEFRLKQQIKKQFEHYLDPRQVAALQKNPDLLKLGGDRREMSFLFMDIIGFTPISEFYKNKDDPEGLVELVNEFLDEMTTILLNNGGMIDKFMGDCIMAVFNAPIDMPNHAEMAVKSAIEIEAKTLELKQRYKERGLPDINVGTGVNTGTAIVGNMGSTTRFDFSVIGDAVNLAARLEATAGRGDFKDSPTLYSSYTMEQLTDIKSVEVDKIKVKGKEELITIYKPV